MVGRAFDQLEPQGMEAAAIEERRQSGLPHRL